MQWSYPELRLRLVKAELWPQGRMARLACYLAGLAAGLYVLEKILGIFAASWGQQLSGWVGFLAVIASMLFFILAFRWARRRILWRLRNRLIVTYVFIGVIPAVLLVAMAGITLYGLAGQFAVFVVTSEIHAQLRSMEAVNAAVSNELAARLDRGEKPTAESLAGLRKRDPAWERREVCAWYGGKPLPLCSELKGASLTLPTFVKGKFRDIVREPDQLYLRVASTMPVGSSQLIVVTSEPFDKELVGAIAANLGEITLYPTGILNDSSSKPADKSGSVAGVSQAAASGKNQPKIVVSAKDNTRLQPNQQELHPTFTIGSLPVATGSFDREITFGTPLAVVDWKTGQQQQVGAVLQVTTRPAVLYGHLFAAFGEFVRGVAYIMVGVGI